VLNLINSAKFLVQLRLYRNIGCNTYAVILRPWPSAYWPWDL